VEQIAYHSAMTNWPLLIDTAALRNAGVTIRTPVKVPSRTASADYLTPWDSLELTVLHSDLAALLTTRRQVELWGRASGLAGPVSPSMVTALAEAANYGQDASGRFMDPVQWVGWGSRARGNGQSSLLIAESTLDSWTEWEAVAGTGPDDEIVVIRREVVS